VLREKLAPAARAVSRALGSAAGAAGCWLAATGG
jgi:hypothetical protein